MEEEPYCYQPCSREEALVVDPLSNLPFSWVRVASGEIYQLLDKDEPLPEGAQYIRPLERARGNHV